MRRLISDTAIATLPIIAIFVIIVYFKIAVIDSDISLQSFAFFIILTPLVEEILFRGLIQSGIAKKIGGKILFISYANIITSIIFAVSHIFTGSPLHAVLTFFPSLVFGLLYERNKTILPSIITHSVYNLNTLLIYTLS